MTPLEGEVRAPRWALLSPRHPLWRVGFRPLFALACVSGALLPVVWMLMLVGVIAQPSGPASIVIWHAHEMFYGFGWAMVGGFLLTAAKNWVGIRGVHGGVLMALVAAWLIDRTALWTQALWHPIAFRVAVNLYLAPLVAILVWTLLRHRDTDSYRDNVVFMIALPVFVAAKNLMLEPESFRLGTGMTLGLFRVAFLVMLERTLEQFMRNVFGVRIMRSFALDAAIKGLALALVADALMPDPLSAALALALAVLLALRLALWHPWLALSRIDIGIMVLGYFGIIAQLALAAGERLFALPVAGGITVHAFSFGVMGLIIPAMVVRLSKGHTGRKVVFDRLDRALLWVMIAALALRVVAPLVFPQGWWWWLGLAALCWFVCFAVLALRYVPFLLAPRVDGKEH